MRKLHPHFLYLLLLALTLTACNNEDDLDDIFVGKTWYMNGATINGLKLNSEISNFYTDAGEGAYYITFSSQTFQGMLSAGVNFSGTWTADGKNQSITLNISNKPATTTTFDKQIYNILSATTSYKSGADFLQLKQDNQNLVLFGDSRNKVYN